jgi:hypothetical protein
MSPWLKAGLIGTIVLIVVVLAGLIPVVGVLCCLSWPVVYAGVGMLAATFVPPRRDAGRAAGQGALAAALAALAGGLANTLLTVLQFTGVTSADVLSQLPPGFLEQFKQLGGDPTLIDRLISPAGALLTGGLCCGTMIVLAAVLGAIGGAVFAAIKPE